MESNWMNITGLPTTAPTPAAASNLNPNANEFVPKNVENNGSSTISSLPPAPPAPFRQQTQQCMPVSSEITNIIPSGYYQPPPSQHPQYVPVQVYSTIIPNYIGIQLPPISFAANHQLSQTENLKLQPHQMSLEYPDQIHENYETYLDNFRKGRGDEGNKRLVSDRDSRNSEESDQEKSFSTSNEELISQSPDNNASQIQKCRSPRRSRESSRENNRASWNEEQADDKSDGSVDLRQPHNKTNRHFNENFHGRGREKRFSRGNHNYTHRDHKHLGYQEADHTNEECFNERSDRSIDKRQYNRQGYNDDYRRGRGRRGQYIRGNGNFSHGDRKKDFNKNYERNENRGKDRNEHRSPNEYDHRRGRDKETCQYQSEKTDFRHEEPSNINPESPPAPIDSQEKYESTHNIDKKANNEHSSEKSRKKWGESSFSEEKSVEPSSPNPFGLGSDENDQMWPKLPDHNRGRERGNKKMGDKGPTHSKQTDFGHNRNEKEKDENSLGITKHNEKNYDKKAKSFRETNTFLENKPERNIKNTEESVESKKETKIQQASYSEKTQNQNVRKKIDIHEENDWNNGNTKSNSEDRSRNNQKHGSKFPEDSKKKDYNKSKKNLNLEDEHKVNKSNNFSNQPRKFDSGRENKPWNITSNMRNKDDDNCDSKNRYVEDTGTHQRSYERAVGDFAQKESNKEYVPDSLVDLDSEAVQEPEAHAKKEKDKRSQQRRVSKFHQSYSDTYNGDKQGISSDIGDNFSLTDRLIAEENEIRKQNRLYDKKCQTVKDDDKKNTRRKSDETKKLLDPRMERNKENAVGTSMRVTLPRESSTPVVTSYLDDSLEKEKRDKDYDIWDNHWEEIDDFKIVCEIEGDLFEQPKDFSLAHCVAEDLRMGSGIAVNFKREFKNLENLLDQRARQGGLAILPDQENGRFVYYLVTKKDSTGKPTYYTMWKALCKMRDHIKENEVKKLAIPRLGCGLDRLEWDKVKSMLEYLFKEMKIEIRVCNFQQPEQSDYKSKCKLVMEDGPVTKIDPGTLILYLATTKGEEDDVIKNLSKKFDFWPSFKKQEKTLGDIVYFDDKIQNYGICACIVRRTRQEPISFLALHSCLQKINKKNKEFGNDCFEYVALQWVDANDYFDNSINQKLITMLINFLRNVDVYICSGDFDKSHST